MLDLLAAAYSYGLENSDRFVAALLRHLLLSGVALAASVIICVPLGIFIARRLAVAQVVLTVVGAETAPSEEWVKTTAGVV